MVILVKNRNGYAFINGKPCSFETKKIRKFISEMLEVNKSFVLPKKYTYVITEINGFAKIIKTPKQ